MPLENGSSIPVGVYKSGSLYAVHTDHLGTPRLITDSTKTPAWQWPYSAFGSNKPTGVLQTVQASGQAGGAILKATAPGIEFNNRFSGQYWDSESNLAYNYYRSYCPACGTYTQPDRIGLAGGLNRFTYVAGDPIGAVDQWGLDTYTVNRDLARFGDSSASQWNPLTHTFTAVTNPDGSIAHTYSWGNDANLKGWNIDQPLDIKTAREALANGKAQKVGDSSLDPFVQKAFDQLNKKRNEHANWIVTNNCKTETKNLLDRARQLQRGE